MKYNSHPNKTLIQHLLEVKDYSINQIPQKYKEAYIIIAYCHDFGKYTSYFQDYLRSKKRSSLSNHGFISAIFGAYIGFKQFGEGDILPLIIYNVIINHHGSLENFSENLPYSFKNVTRENMSSNLLEKVDIAYNQMKDIKLNMDAIIEDMSVLGIKQEFIDFMNATHVIEDVLGKLKKLDLQSRRSLKSHDNYFIHQMLYSALIFADKLSAADIPLISEQYVSFQELNIARKAKFTKSNDTIDIVREEIFNNVVNKLEKEYNNSRIFSITAPTGTGKTITGFFAALKLKELLGDDRKIIYSLPFTSIIEQNYERIYDLFDNVKGFEKNHSRFILKHHSLSNVEYENEYRDYSKTEAELLIENWTSGVIITTFVQLLETLIGTRNRMLKKFISIKRTIIILDEVQAIDIKYFALVEYVLKKICEYFDVYIIIMTATKPLILTEAIELVEDNEKYFKQFNRTKLIVDIENKPVDEFITEFIDRLENKSYMIVCNTIKESLDIYKGIKNLDRDVYYLSTNLLPIHRQKRIQEIKDKLSRREKIILVSTQVVEAGVDLDFDIVIRDMGPIDSIIQCAGRCNRNSGGNIGEVYIKSIIDQNGRPFSNYIYGSTLINISKDLLSKENIIYEKGYYELINEYFRVIKENKSQQESRDYIESILNLNFSDGEYSLKTFSLIKDNPGYIDVFFIYDDTAELAYEKYKTLLTIKDYEKKREIYLSIQKDIRNYTISVPVKYYRLFTQERGLIILPKEGVKDYYNEECGFIREDNEECLIF